MWLGIIGDDVRRITILSIAYLNYLWLSDTLLILLNWRTELLIKPPRIAAVLAN